MKHREKTISAILLFTWVICLFSNILWAADDVFEQIKTYEFGQSREILTVVEKMVRESHKSPTERKRLVNRLAAMLETDATYDCKQFVCRQLSIIGDEEQVSILANLLTNERLSDMARYALEQIPAAAVDKALRDTLNTTEGKMKVGVINSLGRRGDVKAVDVLSKLIYDTDTIIAETAAVALGKIGGEKAAKVLDEALAKASPELWGVLAESYLLCADKFMTKGKTEKAQAIYTKIYTKSGLQQIRIAALNGMITASGEKADKIIINILKSKETEMQTTAVGRVPEIPGVKFTKAMAKELPKLSTSGQIQLLTALGDRGDVTALPAVIKATKVEDEPVRIAAFKALGRLGDASHAALLAQAAAKTNGAEQQAARNSLDGLRGSEVDSKMLASLKDSTAEVRAELIRSLGQRHASVATSTLLNISKEAPEPMVRLKSIKSLSLTAQEKDLPALVNFLVSTKNDAERSEAEKTVLSVCRKITEQNKRADVVLEAMSSVEDVKARVSLLRVLGKLAVNSALPVLQTLVKDNDADIKDAAIRGLSDWPNDEPLADLLQIAKTSSSEVHRILALRGYIRLIGFRENRPAAEALKMYLQAMKLASNDSEKKMLLSEIAKVRGFEKADIRILEETLDIVESYLDNPALQNEAVSGTTKLAKVISKSNPEKAKAVMEKILKISKDENIRKEAEEAIKQISTELEKKGLTNPFFSMNATKGLPAKEQAEILKELGYDGAGGSGDIPELLKEFDKKGLKIFTLYNGVYIDPDKEKYDPQLKETIRQLKDSDTIIWLTIVKSKQYKCSSPDGDPCAVEIVREIADMAAGSGLWVALYPHHQSWLERVEDAVRITEKVNRTNVGVTFNLCHWLRVDNEKNMKPLLELAMPYLFVVTINGADSDGMEWDRLIQTLDKGSFDNCRLLKTLKELGYTGPIGLQSHGIKGDVYENLKRSMQAWRKLLERIAADKI